MIKNEVSGYEIGFVLVNKQQSGNNYSNNSKLFSFYMSFQNGFDLGSFLITI